MRKKAHSRGGLFCTTTTTTTTSTTTTTTTTIIYYGELFTAKAWHYSSAMTFEDYDVVPFRLMDRKVFGHRLFTGESQEAKAELVISSEHERSVANA